MTHPRECWGLGEKMAKAWRQGKAVRIGEAAVVSRKLHTISPVEPDTVSILKNADAGQIFYKRTHPGEVIHLDLFHQVMAIPPREIANWLTSSVMAYQTDWAVISGSNAIPAPLTKILDMIDIQTGAGGGRLTGKLHFGQRHSICQAHMNHVHLTVLLPDRFSVLVFYLVHSLEQYLLSHGIEIRKINHLVADESQAGPQQGQGDYSAHTDSLLLEYQNQVPYDQSRNSVHEFSTSGAHSCATTEMDRLSRSQLGSNRCTKPQPIDSPTSYVTRLSSSAMTESTRLLSGKEGRLLRGKLRYSFARSLTNATHFGRDYLGPLSLHKGSGRAGTSHVANYSSGEHLGELAVVETMTTSLLRQLGERRKQIATNDLRVRKCRSHSPCNVCLLIDASASMKGKRLQAATSLAKHLVAGTRDKVAVLIFQENEVKLVVPFTRKLLELSTGLELIKPHGLTPLASGLAYARDYLQDTKVRNPLLVLVSDGIPTVPSSTNDPIGDAIREAGNLREANVRFCCIGLEPNQNVLAEVTASAKGTLHTVKELESEALVKIVSQAKETARY